MYWPFFAMGCGFEINSQRLATYLNSSAEICSTDEFHSVRYECNCPPLHWEIPDNGIGVASQIYRTPQIDQVGWYDSAVPESGKFLGFLIEDVTMNSVVSRTVTTRISSSGGGVLGPLRSKERRLDFTVLLFACNESAMEYGFRYLTDALGSGGCDEPCTSCDAEFRDSCPSISGTPTQDQVNQGRWMLKNVGLVDGPTWDTPPVSGLSCNFRRVKFSLASEYPWKFKCPVVEQDTTALVAGHDWQDDSCTHITDILCLGTEAAHIGVTEPNVIGETGLVIEVHAGTVDLQHMNINIYPDPLGYICDVGSRPAGYVLPDPCDVVHIPNLPAYTSMIYDTAVETITIYFPGGSATDGTPYITTAVGTPPSYPTIRCGSYCIVVDALSCSIDGNATVKVSSIHREL